VDGLKIVLQPNILTGLPDRQERHGFIALIIVLISGSYAVKKCYIDESIGYTPAAGSVALITKTHISDE
jgi:hypothetical protein